MGTRVEAILDAYKETWVRIKGDGETPEEAMKNTCVEDYLTPEERADMLEYFKG